MDEFENIYRTYFKDVYLYVRSICQNEDVAEEITAETFFKAMKALDSFRGTCDIRIWLCQIAKNCYFSYLRKSQKQVDISSIVEPVDESDLLQRIYETDESLKIMEIVHSLNEPYKEIFMLRVFGELSFKQIAHIFNKNENWACVTFHRARSKIKDKMEDKHENKL